VDIAVVTGSAGLIGAETSRFLHEKGFLIVGIDNDMRRVFFGDEASTSWSRKHLESTLPNYRHHSLDIREMTGIADVFSRYNSDIKVVIHTAAQPSHDWAARDPVVDFDVNARGTLILLEATRQYCPEASFLFTSTNKVYGDAPNSLPLEERETRWEVADRHPYHEFGIDESMSVDQTKHSVFGASKVAADVMVQEYGRYFGMNTVCFRGGCLTGPGHSGTQLHGFLSYLVRCAVTGTPYTIFGYKGKQVRDNIHSMDLVNMFWHYMQNPRPGEVYNAGGGRHSNCSVLEAIAKIEKISGKPMAVTYADANRIGDHIWWISDTRKFQWHYPGWSYRYDLDSILTELYEGMLAREQLQADMQACDVPLEKVCGSSTC
jgi:CDP-paratose 2-epimerase